MRRSEFDRGRITAYDEIIQILKSKRSNILRPPQTITDGFGSTWLKRCPECKKNTMSVVRPGKVQCNKCG